MKTLDCVHPATAEKLASFAAAIENLLPEEAFKKLTRPVWVPWLKLGIALFILNAASGAIAASPGDSGSTVSCIQQQLNDFGYFYGPFTAYYGALTQDAVTRFQQDYGLRADGVAGPATLSKLGCASELGQAGSGYRRETLSRGAKGSRVSALQRDLTAAGFYTGPITGYFGSLTEQAVIRLQQYYGLRADGVADSSTLSTLASAQPGEGSGSDCEGGNLARGSRGSAVYGLQRDLKASGFYTGPITGYFGSLTEDAVIRFQRYYGLRADGVFGPSTQRLLDAVASSWPADRWDAVASR